jgi:MOSC domain-containing protein YiiM
MKLTSVNCGLRREVAWHGRSVTTSIYKEPVGGRVALRRLNLDGDRQADLTVHGGKDKAVYCYPIEHYEYWRAELPGRPDLPMGVFGENFTIEGFTDGTVHIGDRSTIISTYCVRAFCRVSVGLKPFIPIYPDARCNGPRNRCSSL